MQDAGRLNRRNSQIMLEDFDIFTDDHELMRNEDKPRSNKPQQKRFSTHLAPSDALASGSDR